MYSNVIKYSIIFIINIICEVGANINVSNQGVLPLTKGSVALQLFVDVENQSNDETCKVMSRTEKCCLVNNNSRDCNIEAYGGDVGVLRPREKLTMIYIYPTIYLHDKLGFCDLSLEYNCGNKYSEMYNTRLRFDTNVFDTRKRRANKVIFKNYIPANLKVKPCATNDRNPLENCAPVICDWKYEGFKPYFNKKVDYCEAAVPCVGGQVNQLPVLVYVPKANVCKNMKNAFTVEDVYDITSGINVGTLSKTTEEPYYETLTTNLTSISQNLSFLKDIVYVTALLLSVVCILNVCLCFTSKSRKRRHCEEEVNWWQDMKCKFLNLKKTRSEEIFHRNVKSTLLRDIITRDIPLELRDSALHICEKADVRRMGNNRRYRRDEIGSQMSLQGDGKRGDASSTSIESNERSDMFP